MSQTNCFSLNQSFVLQCAIIRGLTIYWLKNGRKMANFYLSNKFWSHFHSFICWACNITWISTVQIPIFRLLLINIKKMHYCLQSKSENHFRKKRSFTLLRPGKCTVECNQLYMCTISKAHLWEMMVSASRRAIKNTKEFQNL